MKTYNEICLSYETDPYATHQPALIWALENSMGNILELGVGDTSTLLLHNSIKNTNKKIISVDDNQEWLNKYAHLKNKNHDFIYVNPTLFDWNNKIDEFLNINWGIVFVDHANVEHIWRVSRPYAIKKLIDCSDFVVAHDSDLFPEIKSNEYNWFEYIPIQKPIPNRNGPSTYILSKKYNLNNIKI